MHANFSTAEVKKILMMDSSTLFKMKIPDQNKTQLFRFKVINLEFMRITFTLDARFDTKEFPIIEVSTRGVEFGRHLANGVSYTRASFPHPFEEGGTYDFFFLTEGSSVKFGKLEGFYFVTIGYFDYEELDIFPYIGFSSTNGADFLVEGALSGDLVQINETLIQRELKMICTNRTSGFYSVWEMEVY